MIYTGVLLSQPSLCQPVGSPAQPNPTNLQPLRDGPDVSWLTHCQFADDQGEVNACVMFAIRVYAAAMYGLRISDAQVIDAWRQARIRWWGGDLSGGLYLNQGILMAKMLAWIPYAEPLQITPNLEPLARAPIIAAFRVTEAWHNVSSQGLLDETASDATIGYHAQCIMANGDVHIYGTTRFVYADNSWGRAHGYRGIDVMTEPFFRSHICEMYGKML